MAHTTVREQCAEERELRDFASRHVVERSKKVTGVHGTKRKMLVRVDC